jgi:hypothetical protein
MESASNAKGALRKALAFEQKDLEREMKESGDEIQMTLDEWRMRKREIMELEESIKFKQSGEDCKDRLQWKTGCR